MNPCPDISTLDDLSFNEREAHLSQCSSCHMLFALREGGEEEFSEDCESTEMLLAIASDTELSALDQRRLSRHLESCARCTSLASDLLLVGGQPGAAPLPKTNTWEPVSAYQAPPQPANDQRSLVFLGLGLLTAAAAIVLIVRGTGDSQERKTEGFVADVNHSRDSASHEKAPASEEIDGQSPKSTVGASRPVPVGLAPAKLSLDEHLAKAKEAAQATHFAVAMSHCSAALQMEPDNQDAHTTCAIAACNMDDVASSRFHIASVTSKTSAKGLVQICKRLGVGVNGPAPTLASDLLEESEKKLAEADYDAARGLCLKALMLEPDHEGARSTCAEIACNLGMLDRAQEHLDKIQDPSVRDRAAEKCEALQVVVVSKPKYRDVAAQGEPATHSTMAPNTISRESHQALQRIARRAFSEGQHEKALTMASAALALVPDDPNSAFTAAAAACNLDKRASAAINYAKLESQSQRTKLSRYCAAIGVSNVGGEPDEDPSSTGTLTGQAEDAVRNTQYGKGMQLAKQVLAQEPENQRALTTMAIAACNLKLGKEATEYVARIKSSQRRQGLKQICLRLGVPSFKETYEAPLPKHAGVPIYELVEQAEVAVRNTQYGKGGRICRQVLEREPGNQRAITSCAISACNLQQGAIAKKYVGRIKNSMRRQGLHQICLRLGVPGFKDEESQPSEDATTPIKELVEQAAEAVHNTQYAKGSRLCRQVLEREPGNQRALTTCAIAACNLKQGKAAKNFVRRVKSSQRRQGLKQICLRLGVPGFNDDE